MGHLIFGVVAMLAGLCGVFIWWDDFGLVLRGLIPITLILVGLVGLGAGFMARNNASEERTSP